MARSSGGRPVRSSHPSWPPLRVRALVNGLIAVLAGWGLLWLTWNALEFTVYDASAVPAVVRVIALWCAVGMPIAWLAIGLHLLVAAVLGGDRVLLSHGAAEWEPGPHDDVLRGVRIRSWRLGLLGGRRLSARTLGWLPELSPYSLLPLAGGILTLLIMLAWMARGYGAGVIALVVAILWLGWRLLRGWQAWSDVRDHRARPAHARDDADATPDEGWDDRDLSPEDPEELDTTAVMPRYADDRRASSGIAATRPLEGRRRDSAALRLSVDDDRALDPEDDERAPATAQLEIVDDRSDEPLRRGRRGSSRGDRRPEDRGGSDDGPPEVLVDRSVQRAIRAQQARRGGDAQEAEPSRSRTSRGRRATGRQGRGGQSSQHSEEARGRPQGLRSYLGERSRQGQEDSGTRSLREAAARPARPSDGSPRTSARPAPRRARADESFDQDRPARRGGGAPTAADAMDEIYGRDDHAPSLLSYLSRRREDDER